MCLNVLNHSFRTRRSAYHRAQGAGEESPRPQGAGKKGSGEEGATAEGSGEESAAAKGPREKGPGAAGAAGAAGRAGRHGQIGRSEEHTSELPSLMRSSCAAFCLKKKPAQTSYNKQT